jgi:CRP-like cAMP-binding protein
MIVMESEESNGEGYILKSWRVDISIWGSHIAELWAGDIFGEIALLNEEERTASVCAEWDIEVIVLKLEDIIQIISVDDKINKTVMARIEENLER